MAVIDYLSIRFVLFITVDSLSSDYSLHDQSSSSPHSAKSSKHRYRAISMAGVIAAAAIGIDITQSMNENAEVNLRKLSKSRSRDSSFSSLTFNSRSRKGSSSDKHKISLGDASSLVYGTYRKNKDSDSGRRMVLSSHPNLIDLDDISSPLRSYDVICDSDDYDPFASPYQDSRSSSTERTFRYSDPELDSINRNVSKGSLHSGIVSPSHGLYDRPERPSTLNLNQTNEYNYRKNRKFGIAPKISNLVNNSAFPNSSTSSSSQSPASTPSPKTIQPPPDRKLTLLDMDDSDSQRLPMPLIENLKGGDKLRDIPGELTFL